MGIPENAAKHALYKTGNSDPTVACTWYFENMDDQSLNTPLRVKKAGGGGLNEGPPQELVLQLMDMGFSDKKAIKALKNTDNNIERAGEWLFTHMDEPDSDHEMTNEQLKSYSDPPEMLGNYQLHSFITHLGKGVHSGHYVCHIKKNDQWVYYNDAKVALMD
mmetsp:Transcript_39700/g.38262  ORF Transcript_39700/g.38262 Transcript_39700/m.38262 type:complete len:162 (+) Transcript_39700:1626-2111(+)